MVATGVPVSAGRTRNVGYAFTDLPHGRHTVQVASTTGGLRLDSVGVYGVIAAAPGQHTIDRALDALVAAHDAPVRTDTRTDQRSGPTSG